MYENDPNRLNRPSLGEPVESASMGGVVFGGFLIAAIIAFALVFWPRDTIGPSVTENAPRIERPTGTTTPPANRPVTPAPTPPQ